MKTTSMVVAAMLALSGSVYAQDAWTEIEDDDMLIEPLGMTVDNLEDADLIDPTGENIGEVDDVLLGQDGSTMAVSLDVGGFLGIGEKNVVIPIDSLTMVEDGVSVDMTKDELEALPEYDG